MPKEPVNYYKLAPTWLYKPDGSARLFETREEVDLAWEEGWYGPPRAPGIDSSKKEEKGAPKPIPKLSDDGAWSTKAELEVTASEDPRYREFRVDKRKTRQALLIELIEFEDENRI